MTMRNLTPKADPLVFGMSTPGKEPLPETHDEKIKRLEAEMCEVLGVDYKEVFCKVSQKISDTIKPYKDPTCEEIDKYLVANDIPFYSHSVLALLTKAYKAGWYHEDFPS
jgi:hypothetical protein